MKVLYGIKKIRSIYKPIVTVGVFDGVHLGHRKLLGKVVREARRKKRKAVVITFKPHPYSILHPHKTPPMLLSLSHRLKFLESLNIDIVLVLDFNRKLANMSASDFVKDMLVKRLNIGELFIGSNFKLGRDRKGRGDILKRLSLKYGFKLIVVKAKKIGAKPVSSTLIRKFVVEGKFDKAEKRLDRLVSLLGTVVKGDRRGRILGFQTANLNLHHEAVPPAGVYAVFVNFQRKIYNGVLNIGFRPTFKKAQREKTVEVHLFDFNKSIYGKDIEVLFVKKIRDERHFTHRDHLLAQIRKDVIKARKILSQ